MPDIPVPMVIKRESSDEEIVQYLNRRQAGDPLADNVLTYSNPFDAEPLNLHDALYLGKFGFPNSHEKEGAIKETGSGYWKSIDSCIISTDDGISCWKTTLQFYEGKPPDGKSTGWVMHQYQAKEGSLNEVTGDQENTTLCRIVLENDIATDGINVEEVLLQMLEQEGNSSSPSIGDKIFQEKTVSSKIHQNPGHETAVESMDETRDFLNGEYLELNDFGDDLDLNNLYSPGTFSASSDNSSRITFNSDDYFDPEAFLMDLQDGQQESVEEHHHLSFNISAVAKSNQVFAKLPSPGCCSGRDEDADVKESSASSIQLTKEQTSRKRFSSVDDLQQNREATPNGRSEGCSGRNEDADVKDSIASSIQLTKVQTSRKRFSSVDELQQNREATPDGRSEGIQPNHISYNSHDRRTRHRNRFMSVGKISRLKKYCCFGSF